MHYVLLVDVKVAQIKIVKRVPLTTVYWKNVPTWRHGTEFPRPDLIDSSAERWSRTRPKHDCCEHRTLCNDFLATGILLLINIYVSNRRGSLGCLWWKAPSVGLKPG